MNQERKGWKSMHFISEEGNLKLLEGLIEKERNLSLLTDDGKTMLHISALNARYTFITELLDKCPSLIDVKDKKGWSALHYSVASSDIEVYQEIAKENISPRSQDNNGLTCLHVAAKTGCYDILKHIIDVCPEVLDMKTKFGRTALHEAVEKGHVKIYQLLVKQGLQVSTQDKDGATCLHLAAANGHGEIVRLILENNEKVKDINLPDGTTALHEAACHGHINVFEDLLGWGLSVKSFSETRGNCLHVAAYDGQKEMVRYILDRFPELLSTTTSIDGWNSLHLTTAGGHIEVFKLLQKYGADPRSKTAVEGNVFHVAVAYDNCEMIRYLLDNFSDIAGVARIDGWTPLHQSAADGLVDIFDTLVAGGVSIETKGKKGETCLHIAASRGKHNMVKHILKFYPHLMNEKMDDGKFALHEAASCGSIETFNELVYNRISPLDTVSKEKETCLHSAAINGRFRMVSHIINGYPGILQKVKINGWNALHLAASSGHKKTCEVLVAAGLSISSKTNKGETVDDITKQYNQLDVLDFATQREDNREEGAHLDIEEKIKLYLQAAKGRKEKRRNIRLMVVGYEGVGKTSFCWRLMNKKGKINSTDGIDIYINRFVINLDTVTREHIKEESGHEITIQRMRDIVLEHCKTSSKFDGETVNGESSQNVKEMIYERTQHVEEMAEKGKEENLKTHTVPDRSSTNLTNNESSQTMTQVPNKDDIKKVMIGIGSTSSQSILKKAYVSLWDCGGHKEFYNSHHLFMSSDAIYVLVFNAYLVLRNKDLGQLKFWLLSIKSHSTNANVSEDTKLSPPIMLIGTHIDNISMEEGEQDQAHEDLEQFLKSDKEIEKIFQTHVVCFYTINTLEESEDTIEDIWRIIVDAAKYQSQWEKLIPARWLMLERELMKRRADGVKVMKVVDIIELEKTLESPTDNKKDIHEFLRYLAFTGEILTFADRKTSEDIVVIHPQWIVHAFRSLITAPKFHRRRTGRLKILWDNFKTTASLVPELISLVWSKDTKELFLDHRNVLLDIMERFGLIASPPQEQSGDQKDLSVMYYVPSMLEEHDPIWLKDIIKHSDAELSQALCFVFTRTVQFPLLDKFLAFCIQKFASFDIPGKNCSRWLQRRFACFNVNPQLYMTLCLSESIMKATLLKFGSSTKFKAGSGYHIRRELESIISYVLQLSNQKNLDYDYCLSVDFMINPQEHLVKAKNLLNFDQLQCWGADGTEVIIKRGDYDVWFEEPNASKTRETGTLDFSLSEETLHRQLTDQEIARISKHIGTSYLMLFCELGLSLETMDHIRLTNLGHDFRSIIVKMLRAWSDSKGKEATVEQLLLAMKMQDFPCDAVIQCLNENGALPQKGLPRKRPADAIIHGQKKRTK